MLRRTRGPFHADDHAAGASSLLSMHVSLALPGNRQGPSGRPPPGRPQSSLRPRLRRSKDNFGIPLQHSPRKYLLQSAADDAFPSLPARCAAGWLKYNVTKTKKYHNILILYNIIHHSSTCGLTSATQQIVLGEHKHVSEAVQSSRRRKVHFRFRPPQDIHAGAGTASPQRLFCHNLFIQGYFSCICPVIPYSAPCSPVLSA